MEIAEEWLQFLTLLRVVVVLCFANHSISADRHVMAASKLLGAAAACVILLSFAAGHRKSYWSGCIKAAIVICQQIFSILALLIFDLKFLLKSASKWSFFCALAPRAFFGAAVLASLCQSVCVCKSFSV